jgi:ribosomal-protein-alanine N-acetyltransferase
VTLLATERLVLRPLQQDDLETFLSIFSNPEVTRYYEVETMHEPAQAKRLLDHFIASGRLGIVPKGSEKIIGSCGICAISQEYYSASLGYDLAHEYWGRGIMTEALTSLLGFGFHSMGLNRISALTYPDNAASIRVLSKLGFRTEGIMREFGFWKGRFHDMSLHALLKREWRF